MALERKFHEKSIEDVCRDRRAERWLIAGQSFAQSGAGGLFTLHNITEGNVVVSFYTNDGSGWSTNWLADHMSPGETAQAEFFLQKPVRATKHSKLAGSAQMIAKCWMTRSASIFAKPQKSISRTTRSISNSR